MRKAFILLTRIPEFFSGKMIVENHCLKNRPKMSTSSVTLETKFWIPGGGGGGGGVKTYFAVPFYLW